MVNLILFPSSYFNIKTVDEDLIEEYDAVCETKLFNTIIFGYEKWFNDNKLVLTSVPKTKQKAIYRGWMMKPDKYNAFYNELLRNNIELVTSPKEYELMHIFPNIYKCFGDDTAKIRLYQLHQQIPIEELKPEFDKFIIKDFVKSVKGTDFPKYFDTEISQDKFDAWMNVFYKYRGDLLTGGICVKEFLMLKHYGDKTNEYRVFYINHKIATISRNSNQPNYSTEIPHDLVSKYSNLDSCYYTVDFAELEDGSWRVIEAGDGSVSGLSELQDITAYYRALYHCFN